MALAPLVLDLKRNSLDDGPGIRTVVFFKGCPLRCVWCQNPEAMAPGLELQRDPGACVGCGACEAVCPHGVARRATAPQDLGACQRCGACVDACPAAARRLAGQAVTVEALLAQALEDAAFYRRSGGGVTLSGGEATMFVEYAGALAAGLRQAGVHVLLETCGQFSWELFARHLLPHLGTVYFDLKLADPAAHARYCGTDNLRILENLSRLVAARGPVVLPRIPLVPGLTDTRENLRALAELVRAAGLEEVALLPYNPLWVAKRQGLGLPLPYAHVGWMSQAEVRACEDVVEGAGLRLVP